MADSKPLSLPPRPRTRRTQAERTAETRARILAATVESILEVGLPRTTAAEISRRSGVTWGAAQHHFGSKDGILGAVLEDSFNRFADALNAAFDALGEEAPLDKRVDAFVDSAWEHFGGTYYRATFEILLEDSAARRAAASEESEEATHWQGELLEAWTRIWRQLFPDLAVGSRRAKMLQHFTISTLSGLASIQLLAGETNPFIAEELGVLKRALAVELESGPAPSKKD
jgi:AcrR family transcriptional regulator